MSNAPSDIILKLLEDILDQAAVAPPPKQAGLDGRKGLARRATIETVHGYTCSEPAVAGEFFSVVLKQEVTFKGKPRMTLEEIGIFHVKDGKVVKEQFFY